MYFYIQSCLNIHLTAVCSVDDFLKICLHFYQIWTSGFKTIKNLLFCDALWCHHVLLLHGSDAQMGFNEWKRRLIVEVQREAENPPLSESKGHGIICKSTFTSLLPLLLSQCLIPQATFQHRCKSDPVGYMQLHWKMDIQIVNLVFGHIFHFD